MEQGVFIGIELRTYLQTTSKHDKLKGLAKIYSRALSIIQ